MEIEWINQSNQIYKKWIYRAMLKIKISLSYVNILDWINLLRLISFIEYHVLNTKRCSHSINQQMNQCYKGRATNSPNMRYNKIGCRWKEKLSSNSLNWFPSYNFQSIFPFHRHKILLVNYHSQCIHQNYRCNRRMT